MVEKTYNVYPISYNYTNQNEKRKNSKLKSDRLLAIGAFLAFARFGYLSDIAMPKSGGGNLPEFEHYSRLAGISFWAIAASWVLAVTSAQFSPQPFRGRALFVLGVLMPIAFITAYVGLLAS
jgi:hypothetical protein